MIAVWKELEPLPRLIEQPAVILGGMVLLGFAYPFVYRSVAASWPPGITPRALRFFFIVWLAGVFSEFIGPFNVLHQPLYLSVVGWAFWTVPAMLTAFAIAFVLEREAHTPGHQMTRARSGEREV
jgi:hypothetical protein